VRESAELCVRHGIVRDLFYYKSATHVYEEAEFTAFFFLYRKVQLISLSGYQTTINQFNFYLFM
jgi:hypothetical protein